VFVKDNQQLVLAVADASGKGVQACFYSMSVRSMLRSYAREYDDVAEAMQATNNLFLIDTGDTGMFVTVLMGFYDLITHRLSYYSYGHTPLLLRKANGDVEFLPHPDIAMGVEFAQRKESHTVQLNRGDTLLFYTDGITEAHDETYQNFGEDRLVECLQKEKGASELVEEVVNRVKAFVDKTPQHDDITLLAMKVID